MLWPIKWRYLTVRDVFVHLLTSQHPNISTRSAKIGGAIIHIQIYKSILKVWNRIFDDNFDFFYDKGTNNFYLDVFPNF